MQNSIFQKEKFINSEEAIQKYADVIDCLKSLSVYEVRKLGEKTGVSKPATFTKKELTVMIVLSIAEGKLKAEDVLNYK